jgi:hypothetical protein
VNSSSGSHLLVALRRILRPIVRILIRAGIRFDEFAELARGVYVETAIRDSSDHATGLTRARASLIAGVTRQQIDYYVDTDGALPSARPTLASVLVEVLQKWHTDAQYVGPYGIPLELEFDSSTGRSFRNLVGVVDATVSPGIVLEELLRVGSVTHSGEKHFRAASRYFMAQAMSPQQLEYFGNTLTRFARTLEYNMNPQNSEKRLERYVVADRGLPPDVLPKFERYARERTNEFLVDLDNWLSPYSSADESEPTERVGTGLNVFLYVDTPEDTRALASLIAKASDPSDQIYKKS